MLFIIFPAYHCTTRSNTILHNLQTAFRCSLICLPSSDKNLKLKIHIIRLFLSSSTTTNTFVCREYLLNIPCNFIVIKKDLPFRREREPCFLGCLCEWMFILSHFNCFQTEKTLRLARWHNYLKLKQNSFLMISSHRNITLHDNIRKSLTVSEFQFSFSFYLFDDMSSSVTDAKLKHLSQFHILLVL